MTEGQSIRISCRLEYQQFEGWYGPSGQRIMSQSETDNVYYHKDANRPEWFLSIKKVHVKDGGTYTCRGTMTMDVHRLHIACELSLNFCSFFLQFHYPPVAIYHACIDLWTIQNWGPVLICFDSLGL